MTFNISYDYDLFSTSLALLDYVLIIWHLLFFLILLSGFASNCFVFLSILADEKMRNTNYFFVTHLAVVDAFVIFGILVVKEITISSQVENSFMLCFPTVTNFIVNFTASNYILLFLCYEKFVLITLPFQKDAFLSMRVKAVFTVSVYTMTLVVALLKFHKMNPLGDKWCPFAYPVISEWASDLIDMLVFFAAPIAFQFALYTYTFYSAKRLTEGLHRAPLTDLAGGATQANAAQMNQANQQQRSRLRQQPQIKIAKTCLVATFVRFILWLPYVVHLVRLSFKHALGFSDEGSRTETEMIIDMFFPDLTIVASCTNPVVFIVMSPPLKRRLKTLLNFFCRRCCCCFPCCRICDPSETEPTQVDNAEPRDNERDHDLGNRKNEATNMTSRVTSSKTIESVTTVRAVNPDSAHEQMGPSEVFESKGKNKQVLDYVEEAKESFDDRMDTPMIDDFRPEEGNDRQRDVKNCRTTDV